MASASNTANSICGIGVGTENCYVAVARQGGIEILLNEYSQRSTPAYVGFGGNQREIGVSAKQKQMMSLSTTCFAPTLIIGKKYSELNHEEIPYNIIKTDHDDVLIHVIHNDEELTLTPTQVLAMLFTKLRQISGNPVDCVINCPNYFTDTQRRALIDASVIAGLNPLKVISDITAVALYYGFYRSTSSSQDTSIVVFVDCGQTSSQASIVLFNHKENYLRVLDSEYQTNVGGYHFDEVLANYFINQQKLKLNKRAKYRLIAECEKLKKQMSANPTELPLNIECLYDDRDFSGRIDRATFEQISSSLLEKIQSMLQTLNNKSTEKFNKEFADKFGKFRVDSVEIVGGTSRIPSIKRMIREIFGIEPSTTLNADEAVARGCALQCAILSPTFKVAKELQLIDSFPYQIDFRYEIIGKEMKTVKALYPRGHQFPYTKQVSIASQTLPLIVSFDYVNDFNEIKHFAQFRISENPETNASEILASNKSPIKIRVKVDFNGLLSISSASVSYEVLDEVKQDEPMDHSNPNDVPNENDQKMETDENGVGNQEQQQPAQPNDDLKRKTKPKIVTVDLIVENLFLAGKLSKENIQKFIEIESNLILADKNWKEKTDAKNALEEYIYEWRDRLSCGSYDLFVDLNNKDKFRIILEENEKWLFDQEDQQIMHSKSVYDEKVNYMANNFSNSIIFRQKEFDKRPKYLEQLGQRLQQLRKLVELKEPEEEEEIKQVITQIDDKQKWFDDLSGKMACLKTFEDPPFKCDDIGNEINQLDSTINRILNNRKRRANEKRKAAEAEAKKKADEEEQKKKQQQLQDGDQNKDGQKAESFPSQNSKMDVDEQSPAAEASA